MLHASTYMVYPEAATPQAGSRMVTARGWGGEDRELLFNEYGVSFWEDQKVLEMGGGDGEHTELPLNCTFKNI